MTNEEALQDLKNRIRCARYAESPYVDSVDLETVEIAIQAVKKQIPKKPLLVPFNESRLRTFECPVCGSYELKKHCDDCGQTIRWE